MHWADRFVGLRHQERGRGPEAFDCLGLLIEVQARVFGRVIEDPGCSMASSLRPANRAILARQVVRVAVDDATAGDALLFRVGTRALHVGVVIDRRLMLHSYRTAATVEDWTGPQWAGKLEGVYRFA